MSSLKWNYDEEELQCSVVRAILWGEQLQFWAIKVVEGSECCTSHQHTWKKSNLTKSKKIYFLRDFFTVSNLRHPTSFALRHSKWELGFGLRNILACNIYVFGVFTVDRQLSQPLSVLEMVPQSEKKNLEKPFFFQLLPLPVVS